MCCLTALHNNKNSFFIHTKTYIPASSSTQDFVWELKPRCVILFKFYTLIAAFAESQNKLLETLLAFVPALKKIAAHFIRRGFMQAHLFRRVCCENPAGKEFFMPYLSKATLFYPSLLCTFNNTGVLLFNDAKVKPF